MAVRLKQQQRETDAENTATPSDEAGTDEERYIVLQRKMNPHADQSECVCVCVCVFLWPAEVSVSPSLITAALSLYSTSA